MEWIGYIGIGILVLLVLLVLVTNIQIVQQSRAYVVERLGAYSATWGVGLHFKIPFFERVVKKVSLKEQVADFDPQPVITKDNVTMQIDTVIYFQITDPKLYTYGVEHPMNAIENLTATTLRNIIGEMELDQSLTSRDVINAKMRSILDEATDPWGIAINRPPRPSTEKYYYSGDVMVVEIKKKYYNAEADAQNYIQGRFDVYARLFTELSPPVPDEFKRSFYINGVLLPGYTIAPKERAPQEVADELLDLLDDGDLAPPSDPEPPKAPKKSPPPQGKASPEKPAAAQKRRATPAKKPTAKKKAAAKKQSAPVR